MTRSIVLLDGGMGQELIRRAPEPPTPLWSAQVMRNHPDIVRAVHDDHLAAGARMLTLNAYAATRCRLRQHGLEDAFETLQTLSGRLAAEAVAARGGGAALAGCLSPMAWSYRPDLTPEADVAAPLYAEAARLQAPFADVMLCETMASINDARGAVRGAAATGKPVWLAFTVNDADGTLLRSGEGLAEAIGTLKAEHEIAAMLVNCSRPEAVDQAVPVLSSCGIPWGAYANGFTGIVDSFAPGTTVGQLTARRDLGPEAYADHAMRWVAAGASIVGGCCEVGADHIANLAQRLKTEGYAVTDRLAA